MRKCLDCEIKLSGEHFNRKTCEPCSIKRRKHPKGTMTKKQIAMAKNLAGTMPRDNIARKIGVSVSNLKRSCKGIKFYYFNKYANNPDLVKEVCAYYEKNGKTKTQTHFPNVCVRSIVERYKIFKPRQSRWTAEQKIELLKMAGLVSKENQAKFFKRPLANKGSIVSVWQKSLPGNPSFFHGFNLQKGRMFLKKSCPLTHGQSCHGGGSGAIFLWVDAVNHIKGDCPEFIKEAIFAMSFFQNKLFNGKAKNKIKKIISERNYV